MADIEKFYNDISEDYQNYPTQVEYDKQWKHQIKMIHDSKKEVNDRRVSFLKASMTIFLVAVLQVVGVSAWIIAVFFR